jgi:carbon monoxide dehydrogenase subunit G
MPLKVCALLIKRPTNAEITLAMMAQMRAAAITHRPEWQTLSDLEIIKQVLSGIQDLKIQGAINKSSTTTKVGSLIEEK